VLTSAPLPPRRGRRTARRRLRLSAENCVTTSSQRLRCEPTSAVMICSQRSMIARLAPAAGWARRASATRSPARCVLFRLRRGLITQSPSDAVAVVQGLLRRGFLAGQRGLRSEVEIVLPQTPNAGTADARRCPSLIACRCSSAALGVLRMSPGRGTRPSTSRKGPSSRPPRLARPARVLGQIGASCWVNRCTSRLPDPGSRRARPQTHGEPVGPRSDAVE
jgi:hypothetical protein